jgi:sigma-B regulation protein RsbU (phosphoserine phosphatase)
MAKILLVDDSEPNRDMLARRLQRKGHEVLQAVDGQQAIDMTKAERPDLVLMDLNLPVLDGWTATRQIKALEGNRPVPVIALTAHAMSGDRQKALQAGCDDYDTKPVDFPRLLGKIDALFKSPEMTIGEDFSASQTTTGGIAAQRALEPAARPNIDMQDTEDAAAAAASAEASAGRVLVVDDTETNRDVAARWLRRKSYVVDTAEDGSRALKMIESTKYDAVLLDVMMPGINGIEVLRILRESRTPVQLPVIMATAKDASDEVVQALTLGANDYVTKPLDFPVLMARVGTQIALKRSVEENERLQRGLEQRNRELHDANNRMEADLAAAARIQVALLPTSGPQVPGYRFAWLFEPSSGLGGDILNAFSLSQGQVGAYVLDVSGHGVAAALLSVTVSRFLSCNPDLSSMLWRLVQRSEASTLPPVTDDFEIEPPHRVAQRLSERFPFSEVTQQYFTMAYGVLDTEKHQFVYVSAGHPQLLHVTHGGDAHSLTAIGYPIGIGPGDYEDHTIALAKGDRLYIHSDGLSEAMNPEGELFGVHRMLEVLRAAHRDSLNGALQQLSASIQEWTGSAERRDDQSVLAIQRV